MRLKGRRLFAVMAMVAAVLVPAAVASAGGGGGIDDHECDEDHYSALNPQHIVYGRTQGTPVVDGKMQVDLSGSASGMVAFWDQHFSTGSDGVVLVGTNFADLLCGTSGTDEIWGLQGNDRIFGMGAGDGDDPDYSPLVAGSGDRLFGNKGHDFITPGASTGASDGWVDAYARLIGGGRGNDVLYAGHGDFTLVRGGIGNDEIFGSDGSIGDGDDSILRGGDGDDVIHVITGDRTIAEGSAGDDVINGGFDAYQDLNGNNGDDILNGGSGEEQNLYGGGGNDALDAGTGANQGLFGGRGDDEITGLGTGISQLADGGPGDDVITGTGPNPFHAFGGGGNDEIYGGTGGDWLFGDYANAPGQVVDVDIRDFAPEYFMDAGVTGDDYIEGDEGGDSIWGGPGDDTLYGNSPKTTNPNIGLDLSDGSLDDLFGDDGDDTIFGSGASCVIDDDEADGGANFAAGDSSWGLSSATDTVNVEHHSDETPGCVTP